MPKRKGPERNANYALIYSSFEVVARLPHVQNKWLCLPVWIELMQIYTPEIELVNTLTNAMMKRAMKRENNVSTSFTEINLNVYYYGRATSQKGNGSLVHFYVGGTFLCQKLT